MGPLPPVHAPNLIFCLIKSFVRFFPFSFSLYKSRAGRHGFVTRRFPGHVVARSHCSGFSPLLRRSRSSSFRRSLHSCGPSPRSISPFLLFPVVPPLSSFSLVLSLPSVCPSPHRTAGERTLALWPSVSDVPMHLIAYSVRSTVFSVLRSCSAFSPGAEKSCGWPVGVPLSSDRPRRGSVS